MSWETELYLQVEIILTANKIWIMYSHKWDCAASFPISTFMYLWAIYTYIPTTSPPILLHQNMRTDSGNIWTAHRYINVDIRDEVVQIHFREYFSRIFGTRHDVQCVCSAAKRRNALLILNLTQKNGCNWAMPHVETRWDWTPSWILTSFRWWMPPSVQTASSSKKVNDCHWLINYKDTKAKCRHLTKFTCKGTLRQVFIRVYRLEIQSVMLVFSTQLCELLPL